MTKKKKYNDDVIEIISSGDYSIVQQINDGPEEDYEGCVHNLYMILEDDEPTVELLDKSNPQARENCNTYKIEFDTFMGHCAIIIWEL